MSESEDSDYREQRLVGRFYANSFEVGHNALEFKLDCGQERGSSEQMAVYFRIVSSPLNTRQLFRLLGVGLLRYADRFGPIDDGSSAAAHAAEDA